ncbi:uncharacterized protein LOC116185196 [Apis dorsata]|uniref:uncharacterized protein LOC116185196 n=1 Tax=Apis dorsata TaxID=7462 RepID=UPI001293D006|nr:uncharacterized protein LOC116185196 [Apis dorsata]
MPFHRAIPEATSSSRSPFSEISRARNNTDDKWRLESYRTLENRRLLAQRGTPIRLLGDDDRSVRSFNYFGVHSTRAKARFKDVTECVPCLPARAGIKKFRVKEFIGASGGT